MVAPDHPSLDDGIAGFTAALLAESRYFGRRGAVASRPSPVLVRRLAVGDAGPRLAGVVDGEVIGLARIDDAPRADPSC